MLRIEGFKQSKVNKKKTIPKGIVFNCYLLLQMLICICYNSMVILKHYYRKELRLLGTLVVDFHILTC